MHLRRAALREIDEGAAFAEAGVEDMHELVELMRGADMEHVGALLRQHAARHGSGEHMREVEHAHAAQGPRGGREGFGRAVADLLDLDGRTRGEPLALRVGQPFLARARDRADDLALGERFFELVGPPARRGRGERLGRVGAAQKFEKAQHVRHIDGRAQDIDAAPILGGEEIRGRGGIAPAIDDVAALPQMVRRGKARHRGLAEIDIDVLAASRALTPDRGDRGALRRERHGACGGEAMAARHRRLLAVDRDRATGVALREADLRQQLAQRRPCRVFHDARQGVLSLRMRFALPESSFSLSASGIASSSIAHLVPGLLSTKG